MTIMGVQWRNDQGWDSQMWAQGHNMYLVNKAHFPWATSRRVGVSDVTEQQGVIGGCWLEKFIFLDIFTLS